MSLEKKTALFSLIIRIKIARQPESKHYRCLRKNIAKHVCWKKCMYNMFSASLFSDKRTDEER